MNYLDSQRSSSFGTYLLWIGSECIGMIHSTYRDGKLQFQSFKNRSIVIHTLKLYKETEFLTGVKDILFQLKEKGIVNDIEFQEACFGVEYDYELYKREVEDHRKILSLQRTVNS